MGTTIDCAFLNGPVMSKPHWHPDLFGLGMIVVVLVDLVLDFVLRWH
jgi:hypothetical protein